MEQALIAVLFVLGKILGVSIGRDKKMTQWLHEMILFHPWVFCFGMASLILLGIPCLIVGVFPLLPYIWRIHIRG